jgi:hypothetical protein
LQLVALPSDPCEIPMVMGVVEALESSNLPRHPRHVGLIGAYPIRD